MEVNFACEQNHIITLQSNQSRDMYVNIYIRSAKTCKLEV